MEIKSQMTWILCFLINCRWDTSSLLWKNFPPKNQPSSQTQNRRWNILYKASLPACRQPWRLSSMSRCTKIPSFSSSIPNPTVELWREFKNFNMTPIYTTVYVPTFMRKLFSVSAFTKAKAEAQCECQSHPCAQTTTKERTSSVLRELFILREHNNVFAQKSEWKKLMSYYRRCCTRTAAEASNSIFSLFSVVKVFNSPRTRRMHLIRSLLQ